MLFFVFIQPLLANDLTCKVSYIEKGNIIHCQFGLKLRLWGINVAENHINRKNLKQKADTKKLLFAYFKTVKRLYCCTMLLYKG